MRWSRLKKLLEEIFDPSLDLQVFCTVQRGERGTIGRYWFVMRGETIWDYPKNVSAALRSGGTNQDASVMSELMRSYLDAPKDQLPEFQSPADRWDLLELLKAADRRIGARRLIKLKETIQNQTAKRIIDFRLKKNNERSHS